METLIHLLSNNKSIDSPASIKYKNRQLKPISKKILNKTETTENRIYSQIQSLIHMDKQLVLKSSCECQICQRTFEHNLEGQDSFISHSSSYLNLFRLLAHLVLIKPETLTEILGQLRIPLFFFRRNRRRQGSFQNKMRRSNSKSKYQRNQFRQSVPSFLLFKSNEETGVLEFPQVISSYQKVLNKIKRSVQNVHKIENRKFKDEFTLQETFTRQNKDISQSFMHQKYFESSVPSLFLDSTQDYSLRKNRKRPVNYIVHKNDFYLEQEIQNHKIHQMEPFCIFRYQKQNLEEGLKQNKDKYQVFTLKNFQQHIKNYELRFCPTSSTEKLDLTFIESFTKAKQMSVFSRSLFDALLEKFNPEEIHRQKKSKLTPSVYLSEFNANNELQKEQIFKLTQLQIQLKAKKISKIDKRYLDFYDLEALIHTTLNSQKNQEEKIGTIALYKTYKIVNYMEIILKIKVNNLKIRWILNQYNQLILAECLQYEIDHLMTLVGEHRTRKQKIINNAVELLMVRSYDDSAQQLIEILSVDERQLKIQQILKARQIRTSGKKQSEDENNQKSPNTKLRFNKIVKSLELKKQRKQINSEYIPQSYKKFKAVNLVKSNIFTQNTKQSCSPSHNASTGSQDFNKMQALLKLQRQKFKSKQKKYRLKPFKTEGSQDRNSIVQD